MKEKIGAINLLRFMAAVGVLLYHYTFMFYQRGFTYADFGVGRYMFQYGYLGVDLFFIISGFVIALSAEGRSLGKFLTSRLARLYPIFWVCVTITSLALLFGGHLIHSHISLGRYLAGMTMIPGLFNQEIVDGSYWSLVIELKFYFFIFILIALGLFKKIEFISRIITIGLAGAVLFYTLPINWIANFMAGIVFYKIYTESITKERFIHLALLLAINIHFVIYQIADLEAGYHVMFNPYIISLHIVTFYLLFLGISLKKIVFRNTKILNVAGLLTYPIYLLHQQLGQIFFKIYEAASIPLYISAPIVILFIFSLSYIVHTLFEESGRKIIIKQMNRLLDLLDCKRKAVLNYIHTR